MIGKLIFRLPEDREDFELAQHGWKYKCMWDDTFAALRKLEKYEDKTSLTIEEIRKILNEIREAYPLGEEE